MGALTISLFLNDIWRGNLEDIPIHIFLGLVITILFYAICGYGYEIVNWALLAIIAFVLVFSGISFATQSSCNICGQRIKSCGCIREKHKCNECNKPVQSCGCKKSKYDVISDTESNLDLNCPANPISLNTKCGVSRYD